MTQASSYSKAEAEAGELLQIYGHPGMHSEFQAKQEDMIGEWIWRRNNRRGKSSVEHHF